MVLDMPQPTFAMAWSTWDGLPLPARLVLYVLFWPLLELLFIFRVRRYLRQRTLQAIAHHVEDTAEVLRFWSGVLEEEDVEYVVRGWFLGEGRMRRENVMDLIGWSISAENDCRAAHRRLAADIVDRMVEIVGSEKIPEGRNPNLRCMTHTLEPLDRCWKPLGFYLANSTARELGACVLRHFGFVLRREGALEYWFHAGDEDGADRSAAALPLVVLHGVGGLVPYLPLLLQLRWSQPRWPLLVPLLPHCSIRTPEYEPPPPLDSTVLVAELAAAVRRVAAARGQPPRAAFLAHSLGTAVFASFAKAHPALVARAALVDPICFLLYHKDVVYNFLYRQPKPIGHRRQALHLGYWFRLLLHYVLTQEPSIQSCFRREFWWTRHWLHPSDLPSETLVVLSGRDAIVPAHQVHAYLSRHEAAQARVRRCAAMCEWAARDATCTWASSPPAPARPLLDVEMHERAHHGWLMANPFAQRRLIDRISTLVKDAAMTPSPLASPRKEAFPIQDGLRI